MEFKILDILNDSGFESYIVGGAIRDIYMGLQPSDYDIATKARPEEVRKVFENLEGFSVIDTGIDHGTVTVHNKERNISVEITTFRKDVDTDGRNATIEYADTIEEDLARRDFTINAVAYCPRLFKFIDPYGGLNDIDSEIIRTVGNPHERFEEDYLRMFRAVRFASQLDFTLDYDTIVAIYDIGSRTDDWKYTISTERIKSEIDKCFLKSEYPSKMIELMVVFGLIDHIIPELEVADTIEQNEYHKYNVLKHICVTVDAIPKNYCDNYHLLRWAALFHDLGKVYTAEECEGKIHFYDHEEYSTVVADRVMDTLKFSNFERKFIRTLVSNHMRKFTLETKRSKVRKFVNEIGLDMLPFYIDLKGADKIGQGFPEKYSSKYYMDLENFMRDCMKDVPHGGNKLAISGHDIMKIFGFNQGPIIGSILRTIENLIYNDFVKNSKDDILNYLENIKRCETCLIYCKN